MFWFFWFGIYNQNEGKPTIIIILFETSGEKRVIFLIQLLTLKIVKFNHLKFLSVFLNEMGEGGGGGRKGGGGWGEIEIVIRLFIGIFLTREITLHVQLCLPDVNANETQDWYVELTCIVALPVHYVDVFICLGHHGAPCRYVIGPGSHDNHSWRTWVDK